VSERVFMHRSVVRVGLSSVQERDGACLELADRHDNTEAEHNRTDPLHNRPEEWQALCGRKKISASGTLVFLASTVSLSEILVDSPDLTQRTDSGRSRLRGGT
jgi:hypothetical protein